MPLYVFNCCCYVTYQLHLAITVRTKTHSVANDVLVLTQAHQGLQTCGEGTGKGKEKRGYKDIRSGLTKRRYEQPREWLKPWA